MTWLRSLRFRAPIVAILLMSLQACALPSIPRHSAAVAVPRCAQLVAHAVVSPTTPITGVMACFAPNMVAAAAVQQPPIVTDADFAANFAASPPVLTAYSYLGHTAKGWYFQLSNAHSGDSACLRTSLDAHGLVNAATFVNGACPAPLP